MATAMQQMTAKPMTADELLRMPEDGFRYELVEGELKKMAPAGGMHGKVAINIAAPLKMYVSQNKLGTVYAAETGFLLSTNPDTVRAPDTAYVETSRVEKIENEYGYFPGAPDLAVEVNSPNDIFSEVQAKAVEWLEAGTKMVIVADPQEKQVTVYRSLNDVSILTEKDTLDGGDVVPGWSMDVKDMFV